MMTPTYWISTALVIKSLLAMGNTMDNKPTTTPEPTTSDPRPNSISSHHSKETIMEARSEARSEASKTAQMGRPAYQVVGLSRTNPELRETRCRNAVNILSKALDLREGRKPRLKSTLTGHNTHFTTAQLVNRRQGSRNASPLLVFVFGQSLIFRSKRSSSHGSNFTQEHALRQSIPKLPITAKPSSAHGRSHRGTNGRNDLRRRTN
jgi:hypothetical protein